MRLPPLASAVTLALCLGCSSTPPLPTQRAPSVQAPAETPSAQSRRENHSAANATAGHFDFYLLNLSWNPEYCATHNAAAECAAHSGFVVHGLWPQNNDGTFPEHCSNAPGPANPSQYLDLQPTLSLIAHEWQTHGTCTGLAPDAYFQAIRKAFHKVVIPAQWQPGGATPQMLTPQVILQQFATANPSDPRGTFALTCGSNRLTAIEACFTTGLTPQACENVRSCKANIVKITAP